MFYSPIALPDKQVHDDVSVQRTLALMAASLDARFVQAGATLTDAITVVDRVVATLDGITGALDEHKADAAIDSLEQIARRLSNLPDAQTLRKTDLVTLVRAGRTLNDRVIEMRETLSVLRIYGTNIKIAASGEQHFVDFVEGMAVRLGVGEQYLDGFLEKLKELMAGVAGVQQAERLLAEESSMVTPHVPQHLANAAAELRAYLGSLGQMANRVAKIARNVQQRIGVVLGALQIGDITRQRLEHVVAALEILATRERSEGSDPVVEAEIRSHIHALLSAQLSATTTDFEREGDLLLSSLRDLGPDTVRLLGLMEAATDGEGRRFLKDLERGISDVEPVIARLGEAGDRSKSMVLVISDVVNDLTNRIQGLRSVQLHVQDISTNTRLMCRRFGTIGKAVAVIATEVDAYALRLGAVMGDVALPIRELAVISQSMRHELEEDSTATFCGSLATVLSTIREGCTKSERSVKEGCDDARQFIDVLQRACDALTDDLGSSAVIKSAASKLSSCGAATRISFSDETAMRNTLDAISRLYSMSSERSIHDLFILPGMTNISTDTLADTEFDDDGLF